MDENKEVPQHQTSMKFTDFELNVLWNAVNDFSRGISTYQEFVDDEMLRGVYALVYRMRTAHNESENQQLVMKMRLEGKTYEEISQRVYMGDGGTPRIINILHRRLNGSPEPDRD